MNHENLYDVLTLVKEKNIKLLDGKGSVTLVDTSPRLAPIGRTGEYAIVQAARVSYGLELKSIQDDEKLLKYLIYNKHTSPIEMCNVTLRLVLPKAIAIHFLRHRTGHFNEYSQRYSEMPEEDNYYNPLNYENGVRLQSKTNKQSSDKSRESNNSIKELMSKANEHLDSLHDIYHEMIKLGLAKEIARFWLPMSEYTTLYMQFDLNNLIKMLTLRADSHAQHETVVYSEAIINLCKPLFPITFECFDNIRNGLFLTQTEIKAFITNSPLETNSVSEKKNYEEKLLKIQKLPDVNI